MEDNLVDIIIWKCYIGMLVLLLFMDVKYGSFKKVKVRRVFIDYWDKKNFFFNDS